MRELRFREQAYGLQDTRVLARCLRTRPHDHDRDNDGDDVLVDVIAGSIVTVVNRAQREWAASGGEIDPVESTRLGLRMLRSAFEPLLHVAPADHILWVPEILSSQVRPLFCTR